MDDRLHLGKLEQVVIETANVLLVGDRVNLFAGQPGAAFGWATVVYVTENFVELDRPYIHTSDFTMCAGHGCTGQEAVGHRLMSYLGKETVQVDRQSSRKFHVVFRPTVPK